MSSSSVPTSVLFHTKGIKANRHRQYAVEFTGERWYSLLEILEKMAEESHHFNQIAEFVSAALDIRRQLRQQGF